MSRFCIKICFAVIHVLLSYLVNAQPENMSLRYFRTEEGLSQNEVTSILQDNEGFMWFGTRSGLNRYDGYDFQVFNQIPGDSNSLVNTSIEKIYKDSKGIIWIGTKSNGISRYDPITGKFSNIPYNENTAGNILTNKRVISFCEGNDGIMWIGTLTGGLIRYDQKTNTSKKYFEKTTINVILKSSNGTIWAGTNRGLFEYDYLSDSFKEQLILGKNIFIQDVIEDKNHRFLWILINKPSSIIKYNIEKKSAQAYGLTSEEEKRIGIFKGITKLMQDNNGLIWIGTWGNGLFRFNQETASFSKIPLYPNLLYKSNKEFDTILDIFQDKNNNIWIGTNGVGICLLTEKLKFNTLAVGQGGENNCVMSVLEDKSGTLWVGTRGNGLSYSVNKVDFMEVPYTEMAGQEQFKLVRAIYQDQAGNIWVGTNHQTGIIRYHHGKPELIDCSKAFDDHRLDAIVKVLTFIETDSTLFLGTQQKGLFILEKKRGSWGTIKQFNGRNGEKGQLQNEMVTGLKE